MRKAEGLIDGGASKVRCVAPEIEDEMPAEVEKINMRFVPAHLDGAALVFAAAQQRPRQNVRQANRLPVDQARSI